MTQEQPRLPLDLKGELLKTLTQRYPSLDIGAVELSMMLKHVSEGVTSEFEHALARRGVSSGKFYVIAYLHMEHLAGRDAPIPSEIAAHLGVTRATVTGLLDGLERDGYIGRRHSLIDRRSLVIGLTDRAQKFMDEFIPASNGCLDAVRDALSTAEQATLLRLLTKIERRLASAAHLDGCAKSPLPEPSGAAS